MCYVLSLFIKTSCGLNVHKTLRLLFILCVFIKIRKHLILVDL